jgi:uncharacterized membrane protein YsdA (DUF1294 family)/cold shock CspA family protein
VDAVRFKGTIEEWNDERGFGFIKPAEGGERVFCHVSAFQERSRRPSLHVTVTYEQGRDERGRLQARQVRYGSTVRPVRESRQPGAPSAPRLVTATIGTSGFFIAVLVTVVMGRASWWVVPWYIVLSVVTFAAYGWDKVSAQGGHWRTQEKTLHMLEMLGGWPGAWLAQPLWRHKSRKETFRAEFRSAAAINVVGLIAFIIFGEELLGLWPK